MPTLQLIKVHGFKCLRCPHEWVPRKPDQPPRVCPSCKSPYWDKERKIKATVKENKTNAR